MKVKKVTIFFEIPTHHYHCKLGGLGNPSYFTVKLTFVFNLHLIRGCNPLLVNFFKSVMNLAFVGLESSAYRKSTSS